METRIFLGVLVLLEPTTAFSSPNFGFLCVQNIETLKQDIDAVCANHIRGNIYAVTMTTTHEKVSWFSVQHGADLLSGNQRKFYFSTVNARKSLICKRAGRRNRSLKASMRLGSSNTETDTAFPMCTDPRIHHARRMTPGNSAPSTTIIDISVCLLYHARAKLRQLRSQTKAHESKKSSRAEKKLSRTCVGCAVIRDISDNAG